MRRNRLSKLSDKFYGKCYQAYYRNRYILTKIYGKSDGNRSYFGRWVGH